jgi:hypothetical protein
VTYGIDSGWTVLPSMTPMHDKLIDSICFVVEMLRILVCPVDF